MFTAKLKVGGGGGLPVSSARCSQRRVEGLHGFGRWPSMCKSLSWPCEQLRGRSICRSWRLLTIKTYSGWIQPFPMICTQCHAAHMFCVLGLASHLVSLLVPCIPAGLECCVRVPGLLIILFPTLSPILFCSRPCFPACFSILLPDGSGMLWPIPWAPSFFCLLLPGISLDPLLQSAGGETCSSRMPQRWKSVGERRLPVKFKFPGNLIPLAYRSIWRISNKPASKSYVLSLPVTLVMSYSDYREPQFEESSIWCMITSSKDPKVFIGFHYFVHC